MNLDELIDRLDSLMHVELDAVRVYDEALHHTDDHEVHARLERLRDEHDDHARQLAATIRRFTGAEPATDIDLRGHTAEWITALRSLSGTAGALRAIRAAEKYHNRRYAEAVRWDIDDRAIAEMLQRFLGDEREHLEYVEAQVEGQVLAAR